MVKQVYDNDLLVVTYGYYSTLLYQLLQLLLHLRPPTVSWLYHSLLYSLLVLAKKSAYGISH